MAIRFHRSLKLLPGVRLNFGKRGIGIQAPCQAPLKSHYLLSDPDELALDREPGLVRCIVKDMPE
jgi:hypothetical protein